MSVTVYGSVTGLREVPCFRLSSVILFHLIYIFISFFLHVFISTSIAIFAPNSSQFCRTCRHWVIFSTRNWLQQRHWHILDLMCVGSKSTLAQHDRSGHIRASIVSAPLIVDGNLFFWCFSPLRNETHSLCGNGHDDVPCGWHWVTQSTLLFVLYLLHFASALRRITVDLCHRRRRSPSSNLFTFAVHKRVCRLNASLAHLSR